MSSTWNEIHQHLLRSSSTLAFQRAFDLVRRARAELASFSDAAGLLDALHRGPQPPDEKNVVLGTLVEVAQSDAAGADHAVNLLLLALWPGLDAVYHRLGRRRVSGRDELPSQILAGAVEAVRRIDLGKVRRIAATILMNIERDIGRVDAREEMRRRRQVELDVEQVGEDRTDHPVTTDLLCRDVTRLIGDDGDIVLGVAVHGLSHIEIAVALGLSEAAARKRYQRAARRLRRAYADDVSRPSPLPGFSRVGAVAPSRETHGAGRMTFIDDVVDLTRMPGLFRRWEFPDVLETRRTYRLEEAGAHADGTPLVSIYTGPRGQRDRTQAADINIREEEGP